MNPIFIIRNSEGKSKFEDKDAFINYVKSLGNGVIEVIAKKKRKPRSTGKDDEKGNQNGYYRGVVVPISAKFLGNSQEEMHEVFISAFAPYIYKTLGDKKVAVKIRTSEMDTKQMAEFTEACRSEMAQQGCVIPDPERIN